MRPRRTTMREMGFMEKLLDGAHVEWKSLASICKIETGKLNANAATEDGAYMFFTTAKEVSKIDKYRWDTEALLIAGNANVGDVKHYSGKFEAYQRTYVLTNFSEKLNVRYLFHIVSNSLKQYLEDRTNSAAMTYIVLSTLENFPIPIPCPDNPKKSLEIQAEIVRILDAMTAHTAELTAELTARKKQYDYYRDKLLSFEEGAVEWKPLGEVCDFKNGFAFKSDLFRDTGFPIVRITNINGSIVDMTDVKYFNPDEYKENIENYVIEKGDILIAMSGATTGKIGYFENKKPAYLNQRVGKFIPKIKCLNNRYLYHFLLSKTEQIYVLAGGGAQPNLSSKALMEKIKIPIPYAGDTVKSNSEQKRIAEILDKLDKLINSITEGLPREIELRQKQYAYYRDLLLSFPAAQAA